jgi:predicted ATPase
VGKTRLALTVAADLRDVGRSVWFVDLVPVTEPAMVDAAVAVALVADGLLVILQRALTPWARARRTA